MDANPDEPTAPEPNASTADPSSWLARELMAAFAPPTRRPAPGPAGAPGEVVAGRYTLMETVGSGGMGSVWRAEQTAPVRREVALKLIKAGLDSRAVLARFEAERQALAVMDHPNIAKIFDGGVTDTGRPYFVMELVAGPPITEYCDARKLTPDERLRLFVAVCGAIQHAHQKGVIHRDIKPSNVLVAEVDGKPVPKVIDFGVAKATGAALTDSTLETAVGAVVGTPAYMSPEQASLTGADIDTRSDVYSLGVLLYELLAGSPPFGAAELRRAGVYEMLRVVREVEPPRPSDRLSTADELPSLAANRGTEPRRLAGLLRGELDWVVLKAIDKDRARRYDGADGLAADLGRYLGGEPVSAHPPGRGYRLRKALRRNRAAALATGLVALALVAGLAGTTWGLVRAEGARRGEAAARELAEANEAKALAAAEAEAEQRREAEAANARALRALGSFTDDLMTKQFASKDALTGNDRAVLRNALAQWEVFAQSKGDSPEGRRCRADGARRVAQLQGLLGLTAEAEAGLRRAASLFAALVADFPASEEYRGAEVVTRQDLADLLGNARRYAESLDESRRNLALLTRLAADRPTAPHRRAVAECRTGLSMTLEYLGDKAGSEAEQREAVRALEALLAESPDYHWARLHLAKARNHLGALLRGRSDPAAAGEHRAAAAHYQALVALKSKEYDCSAELADSRSLLALALADPDPAGAAREYQAAAQLLAALVAESPAVVRFRRSLARTHFNYGLLLRATDAAGAEREFRAAVAQRARVAESSPTPGHRADLARARTHLGLVLTDRRKWAESERESRAAVALWKALAAEPLEELSAAAEASRAALSLGRALHASGRSGDALPPLDAAIADLDVIARRTPDGKDDALLRDCHWLRAEARERLGRPAEAVADWDEYLRLSSPRPRWARARRATLLVNAGRAAEAVAEVAELARTGPWRGTQWYDFACAYAAASAQVPGKGGEYAARAVELLGAARRAGFRDAAHMATDADLDPLRGRADYRAFVATVTPEPAPRPRPRE